MRLLFFKVRSLVNYSFRESSLSLIPMKSIIFHPPSWKSQYEQQAPPSVLCNVTQSYLPPWVHGRNCACSKLHCISAQSAH